MNMSLPLLPAFVGEPERNKIYHSDLFDLCAAMPDKSVDMLLCDLPYGITNCAWDAVIPLEPMWAAFKRIIKPRSAIVLTAIQPFTSALVASNYAMFKYDWVWEKTIGGTFGHARNRPLRKHESVLVFSDGAISHESQTANRMTYYPQIRYGEMPYSKKYKKNRGGKGNNLSWRFHRDYEVNDVTTRYPDTILYFPSSNYNGMHPTQKPLALFSYLIRSYTLQGELVFDPCVGSGTTAVAAREEGRQFICGDQNADYVAMARERLAQPYTASFLPLLESHLTFPHATLSE